VDASPKPAPARTPKKEPSFWERNVTLPKIEPADLLAARGLAWAGGVVTLLGVVFFFFVLAVNRGWIGPTERVLLGALASSLVLAGGLVMRHRYGQLYSAVSAVAAAGWVAVSNRARGGASRTMACPTARPR